MNAQQIKQQVVRTAERLKKQTEQEKKVKRDVWQQMRKRRTDYVNKVDAASRRLYRKTGLAEDIKIILGLIEHAARNSENSIKLIDGKDLLFDGVTRQEIQAELVKLGFSVYGESHECHHVHRVNADAGNGIEIGKTFIAVEEKPETITISWY